ncbi:L-type lectin-domain containing receptor kinase IX.1-like [Quercus lobata]|uniref:non-specific serine/threonine protein kinase n=1 Tax=Quercus lobata TaxID=97700 RepID=A0A7N2LL17_QUELO|nr:L-type lectin-domain containing receptor kinase IX.1-like [Quercus lobata]
MDSQSLYSLPFLCVFFFCCFPYTTSIISFSFPEFLPFDNNIIVSGTAYKDQVEGHPSIQLTDKSAGDSTQAYGPVGRAYYYKPIPLWDPVANVTTNFTATFEFVIGRPSSFLDIGYGIGFFITSEDSVDAPKDSGGGRMGLFNSTTNGKSSSQMVAVEFDTLQDTWWRDDPSDNHVGIDVNSIVSKVSGAWNLTADILVATVSYDGTSEILSVFLKYWNLPNLPLNLTYNVKLRDVLPEKVMMGFSAAAFGVGPVQAIRSWNFSSTLDLGSTQNGGKGNSKMWLVGLITGLVLLVAGVSFGSYILWRNSKRKVVEEDEDLIEGTGPKMFAYKDLVVATNNFSEEGKLGQGGFGSVYKGFLAKTNMEIAVKKISSNSNQGKKEYTSEVITISRLRHRNLVQLVGWSHEQEFVVVYEYMPNGSLDSHLFDLRSHLSWPRRSKIVHGLASGLLYLHEEWEQCVVHRDIKSSNVMLDSNFNAKLGDFGLARFVDHELGSRTTDLAGTRGYVAPEYFITSKFSKESDVFSFGVVALEIACGRKVVEPKVEASKISLLNWVWVLYGEGRLLEAVDETLNGDYDMDEMKCLMTIGLWCANPDHTLRPSIRQAIRVLNYEAPLPSLPSKMPLSSYYYAPEAMTDDQIQYFTCTSKGGSTTATKDDSRV